MYNESYDEHYKNYPEALKVTEDSILQEALNTQEGKKEITQEQLKEFETYRKLFKTNRKFRKAVYAQRFSNTAIKPSAF